MEKESVTSIIDKTMTITGEIAFKGRVRIDGTIEGNIDGEHLILSSSGRIKGDIQVASFNCHGTMEGNVIAKKLSARKGCTIIGTLKASTLTVEPGATIQGQIEVTADDFSVSETGKEQEFLPEDEVEPVPVVPRGQQKTG